MELRRNAEDTSRQNNPDVRLREVEEGDLELLLAWRSNELVHRHFTYQGGPLKWHQHWEWWKSRRHRKDWVILLTDGTGVRRVGVANVSKLDQEVPEIGLYIGEVTLWGSGVGGKAVREVKSWLKQQGYRRCMAGIREGNGRSIKLFSGLGFHQVSVTEGGRRIYEADLA